MTPKFLPRPARQLALFIALSSLAFAGVTAPGAKLVKLAGDFAFTEGPTCDREGNVFFTDQPNDRILKWSTEGKLSTFLQPSGRANGMYVDAAGNLLVCADEKNELWSIAPDGKTSVLASGFKGQLLNGPNDVWSLPDGRGLYFTDPYYKRAYWKRSQGQITQQVYFLAQGSHEPVQVTTDLNQPNGIIGTPDGKHLFVADIGAGKTYRYTIQPGGLLAHKTPICQLGSDGMTIDVEGNLYLTGKGVTVFDRTGKQIDHIAVPEPWTANVCIGGKERNTLFITASKSLYAIRLSTRSAGGGK